MNKLRGIRNYAQDSRKISFTCLLIPSVSVYQELLIIKTLRINQKMRQPQSQEQSSCSTGVVWYYATTFKINYLIKIVVNFAKEKYKILEEHVTGNIWSEVQGRLL